MLMQMCYSILSSRSYHLGPFVSVSSPFCQQDPSYLHRKILYIADETVVRQDGSSKRYYPPMYIWNERVCFTGLSEIFRCARGHFDIMWSSYTPALNFCKKGSILLLESGVTRELQLQIFRLCSQGRPFCDIHMLLLSSVQDNNAQRVLYEHHTSPPQQSNHEPCEVTSYMSSDLITNIFIITFHEFQKYMYQEMYDLTSEYTSCNHTFKLASNIGILHEGKWIQDWGGMSSVAGVDLATGNVIFAGEPSSNVNCCCIFPCWWSKKCVQQRLGQSFEDVILTDESIIQLETWRGSST